MENGFILDCLANSTVSPIIIFTDKDTQKLFDKLSTINFADKKVHYICKNEQAFKARTDNERADSGIFVLDMQYARGFDMKLKSDALVMLLTYENKWPLS